jgi:hypothetical protein
MAFTMKNGDSYPRIAVRMSNVCIRASVVMLPVRVVMLPVRVVMLPSRVVMLPVRVVMLPANAAEDIAKVKSEAQRIDLKRLIFVSPGFEQLLVDGALVGGFAT